MPCELRLNKRRFDIYFKDLTNVVSMYISKTWYKYGYGVCNMLLCWNRFLFNFSTCGFEESIIRLTYSVINIRRNEIPSDTVLNTKTQDNINYKPPTRSMVLLNNWFDGHCLIFPMSRKSNWMIMTATTVTKNAISFFVVSTRGVVISNKLCADHKASLEKRNKQTVRSNIISW